MTGTLSPTSQGPWLVKSGERILGPFTTDSLGQLLREKEVVVIDEVMSPQSRWAYLRDVPVFQEIVEEIRRGLMQSREDTEVQGYTATANVRTEVVTLPGTPSPVATSAAVIPIRRQLESTLEGSAEPSAQRAAPKSVMTPRDPTRERAIIDELPRRPSKSGVIVGTIALIAAVSFILYWVAHQPRQQATTANTDHLQTLASVAWKRGEFERALELYRSIDRAKPAQPFVSARLATLMMKLDGQTVEAKRIVESALPNATDAESKSALEMAAGLAALQSDDATEAAAHFALAGTSWIASFDQGVAQMTLKNWPAAIQLFEKSGDQAVALLMLGRAQLASVENGVNQTAAQQSADAALRKALRASPDFQQEVLVLAAANDLQMGQRKIASAKIVDAIDTDPNQTSDHFHDPSLSLEFVSWSKFISVCRSIHQDMNSHASAALLGLCLAKASQIEDATKFIEQELMKAPGDGHLHAVNAYLHLLAGREEAARASLTLAAKNGNPRLAQILNARLCARDGLEACAEDGWAKLAADSHALIAALVGLAQVREQQGDQATANALMVKADKLSPNYLPLLRMREEASR